MRTEEPWPRRNLKVERNILILFTYLFIYFHNACGKLVGELSTVIARGAVFDVDLDAVGVVRHCSQSSHEYFFRGKRHDSQDAKVRAGRFTSV